jgi:hypothetical protein
MGVTSERMKTTRTTGLPAGFGSAANNEETKPSSPVSAAAAAAAAPARKPRRFKEVRQSDD